MLPRISSYTPPKIRDLGALSHLLGLELADPHFMNDSHIDVLLGALVHAQIIQGRVVKGKLDEAVATQFHLGWLLSGNAPTRQSSLHTLSASYHCAEELQLNETLQNFCKEGGGPSETFAHRGGAKV